DSLINKGITERNIVIGGISAGMAIQGSHYFTAQYGTVSSTAALANPYSASVAVSSEQFIDNSWLQNVITDTHYNNPDRKGRHTVFMAKILEDDQVMLKGIACNEYTAVCIDQTGHARVFGEIAGDKAYFIQPNCELMDPSPETCELLTPLTWNRNGAALKVYELNGDMNGSGTFELSDWKTATGGAWKHWSVQNGVFSESTGTAPDCALSLGEVQKDQLEAYPNPHSLSEKLLYLNREVKGYTLLDAEGRTVRFVEDHTTTIALEGCVPGIYFLKTEGRQLKLVLQP
ncbi:MAG: cyanophycinase, partial [Bacteroidota bacterium]